MKITNSSIEVKDIEVFAFHGVEDAERQLGTKFRVNVNLTFDGETAMKYDDLNTTINYAQIIEIVKSAMLQTSSLIEHATWLIINALVEAFPIIKAGTVSVTKVHPPISTPNGGATFTASFTA